MSVSYRHLDIPDHTPVTQLGAAAIEVLLDRGDLDDWRALRDAIRTDPAGRLASTVLRICDAHPMYGTSELWRSWIERMRASGGLAALRKTRGLTQADVAQRMGISQSDVSKLERRSDVRLSTIHEYVEACGGRLAVIARFPDDEREILTRPASTASA